MTGVTTLVLRNKKDGLYIQGDFPDLLHLSGQRLVEWSRIGVVVSSPETRTKFLYWALAYADGVANEDMAAAGVPDRAGDLIGEPFELKLVNGSAGYRISGLDHDSVFCEKVN